VAAAKAEYKPFLLNLVGGNYVGNSELFLIFLGTTLAGDVADHFKVLFGIQSGGLF